MPACQQGALALKAYSVGMTTTDANGHAQTPPLPAGRYWVLSDAKVDNRRMMWNEPVDLKAAGDYNRIVMQLAEDVANSDAKPQWKSESFFRRFQGAAPPAN